LGSVGDEMTGGDRAGKAGHSIHRRKHTAPHSWHYSGCDFLFAGVDGNGNKPSGERSD